MTLTASETLRSPSEKVLQIRESLTSIAGQVVTRVEKFTTSVAGYFRRERSEQKILSPKAKQRLQASILLLGGTCILAGTMLLFSVEARGDYLTSTPRPTPGPATETLIYLPSLPNNYSSPPPSSTPRPTPQGPRPTPSF